ncbi:MAG TPA: KR domain-containing protein [Deltaproteobacteria bacterium]|nr:KR domain-containing protein [Deltaproteobacteria bacterium]
MSESEVNENDIAIVGLALRVPGAETPSDFWKNLREGVESIQRLDEETLLAAGESPETLRNPNYVPAAGPLENMKMFDGEFFGFSPKESAILDPQHRHFTECCWEALEDAGHPPEKFDGQVGVFGGCGMGSYFYFNVCTNRELVESVGHFLLRHTGNDKDFLTTRVAYTLDLRGPAVNVQTACSTSLVATHLACQSLLSGECDLALAGGSTILLPHNRGYVYAEGEVLSPDGHCHAFDRRAQGTVLTSGAGVVALRRLEDALEDGDHVYAVIKGSAINNDGGQKVGYLAPSVDGQTSAMTEAYSVADIDPASISYVECHGTGTYMGDPIEIAALTQAFRTTTEATGFCRIGSVKSNIGHLDTAAGVASLIKVALALDNEELPASISYSEPNPEIGFEQTPFVVNDELREWPRTSQPRRAAVNSLGVGGTNAHVVLEEAPLVRPTSESRQPFQLLKLSARNNKSLDGNTRALAAHLRDHPELALADVAYTLDVGRREMDRRRVLVARDRDEAVELLEHSDPRRVFTHAVPDVPVSVVFMFSGAASQYAGMAADLHASEPVFREHLDRGLDRLEARTGRDLRPILLPRSEEHGAAEEALQETSVQLPAIFLIEYALARLWMSWGVEPDLMIGHSMGENTAACIAGVLSFDDALDLLILRGELTQRADEGAMVSVNLPVSELEPLLEGTSCDLASVNARELCVAAGTIEAVEALEKILAEREVEYRRLPITRAGHSRLFDPILEDFRNFLKGLELHPPTIPFISNRTGRPILPEEATDPEYWVGHLRHTVRFADGLDSILNTPGRLLIEIGPGQALCSFARQHPAARQGTNIVPSLRHRDDPVPDPAFFLGSLGRAWASGLDLDLSKLREGEVRRRVPLPTYAWNHQAYFIEPTEQTSVGQDPSQIERIEDLADWGHRPVWLSVAAERKAARGEETWLVFMDGAGIGRRLKTRLEDDGQRVICVYEGDAFSKRNPDEYTLAPELGRAGYDALIQDLVAHGNTPSQIVHLWLVTDSERFRPGSSFFHQNIQDGFYSLYFLAQALGDESLPRPLHLSVVSNGMQSVGETDALLYPEKATVLGPVKVIPRELPDVTCKSIDLSLPTRSEGWLAAWRDRLGRKRPADPDSTLDAITEGLVRELRGPAACDVVALRGRDRYVRRFEPEKLAAVPDTASHGLRKGGTYLLTGGLGGLALNLADRLARDLQPQLILLGRSPFPPREEWDEWLLSRGGDDTTGRRIRKIRALEEAGARVEIATADVTNLEEMRSVVSSLRTRLGPIHGVFHIAGVVKDELIQLKQDSDIEDVFGPKVYGTLVLDGLLESMGTELFVLFSSTSAIAAPPGQVDYAGANAFLDAYAWSRRDSGVRTISIDWGIWNEIGMAAESFGDTEGVSARERALPTGPMDHPFFDERTRDSHGRTVFRKNFSPQRDWVLDEHRTRAGQALLPGTAYPELARAALAEYGEAEAFEIRDLFFIRPLYLPDGENRDVRVQLRPSDQGYRFEVRTACQLDGRAGWELNAQASLELGGIERPETLDLEAIDSRCQVDRTSVNPEGHRSGQEEHVVFGPRWRVLRRVVRSEAEALAELELPDAFLGDLDRLGLHPALLDYATGYAMDLIEDYRPELGLWIPVSYGRMAIFGRLPRKIYSWVRNRGENRASSDFAVFDVTISDEEGRVLLEIEEYTIKRLHEAPDFDQATGPSRADVEFESSVGSGETRDLSPAERQLRRNYERGIRPREGTEALLRVLAADPLPQVVVSSLDLASVIRQVEKVSEQSTGSTTKFERPDLDSEYVEPRDDIERTLVGMWEELLGVDQLGVRDDFFELGGHSLIAVRLFTMIKKTFQTDFPISVLFEAPTIEGCAALIREARGESEAEEPGAEGSRESRRTRYKYLVAMDPNRGQGGDHPPFFLVAGMFGNVLNLRHLATLVGADRPFYGLQARGLYGDEPPHESFEEMAEAYIEEIRTVQPEGPYYIGGFSGGGLTAFEMAHQFRDAGEEVGLLLLLDSRLPQTPPLTRLDRAKIQWQRMRRRGPGYLIEWARNRARWQMEQIEKRRQGGGEPARTQDQFHNEAIEAAFRAALPKYRMRHYPGPMVLFRPKPDRAYVLGRDRVVDSAKEWVWDDNGFGAWVDSIEVHEMPGDHDSMVLEPNVRVMAARLRKTLAEAEERLERAGPRKREATGESD